MMVMVVGVCVCVCGSNRCSSNVCVLKNSQQDALIQNASSFNKTYSML